MHKIITIPYYFIHVYVMIDILTGYTTDSQCGNSSIGYNVIYVYNVQIKGDEAWSTAVCIIWRVAYK